MFKKIKSYCKGNKTELKVIGIMAITSILGAAIAFHEGENKGARKGYEYGLDDMLYTFRDKIREHDKNNGTDMHKQVGEIVFGKREA